MNDNGFKLAKERCRRYPGHILTDADYAEDIAFLACTTTQAETLQHCLERATAGIGFHINIANTEYTCFKQRGDISTLNGSTLKLVDNITFLKSCVSSTEKDINTRLRMAIDKLQLI